MKRPLICYKLMHYLESIADTLLIEYFPFQDFRQTMSFELKEKEYYIGTCTDLEGDTGMYGFMAVRISQKQFDQIGNRINSEAYAERFARLVNGNWHNPRTSTSEEEEPVIYFKISLNPTTAPTLFSAQN